MGAEREVPPAPVPRGAARAAAGEPGTISCGRGAVMAGSGEVKTAAVLFTDLAGSTATRVRLGEEGADRLRVTHDRVVRKAIEGARGTVVKSLGDGVMATFVSAVDALAAAVAVQQGVERLNRRTGAEQLAVRVGVSVGDVAFDGVDCHGLPVVEAQRLEGLAQPGQILCADVVVQSSRGRGGYVFEPVGVLPLKGLPGPTAASSVSWRSAPPAHAEIVGLPAPLAVERRGPLVGREDAEAVLQEAVAGARDGRRAAFVSGEPGIGKTRLVAEVAADAHDSGVTVVLGRCAEELISPFGPWTEVLGTVIDHVDEHVLAGPVERSGGALARLLPSVVRRFGPLPPPAPADPATERRRLADAIDDLLSAVAADRPLLVVLEDLHWADEATLGVLSHVLRPGRPAGLVVLGTYRDTELGRRHPLSATLGSLRRHPHVTRVPLSGLGHRELADLVTSVAGQELDEAFVSALEAETEGNPFFAKEVLRHLVETGAYERRDGRWVATRSLTQFGLPEGVRDVIGRRLSLLSDDANDVLAVAAVIGAEVDIAILMAAAKPDVDVPEAVDEARRAGVLRDITGTPGRHVFSHALVRQTLLGELSGGHRARAHWRIGEALSRARPERLDQIAYHLTEGVLTGDPGRAVDAALAAGQRALDRVVPEQAALHYERALATIQLTGLSDPERRWAALMGQARAGALLLTVQPVVDACLAAIDLAEEMGWTDRVGEAAIQATDGLGFSMVPYDDLLQVIQRTLETAQRPVDRVRLLMGRSNVELARLNIVAAREAAAEAIELARGAGAWSWLLEAYAAHWRATSSGLPLEEERRIAAEMERVAAREDVVPARPLRPIGNYGVFMRMGAALRAGDRPGVEAEISRAETTFFSENRVAYHSWVALLALADGRLSDVDSVSRRLVDEFPPSGVAGHVAQTFRAEVLTERGDPEGLDVLRSFRPAGRFTMLVSNYEFASLASPPDRSGRIDQVLAFFEVTDPSFATATGYGLAAEAAARHRRADWAARIEPRLRSLGGDYLCLLSAGIRMIPVGRALAQVLLVLGRLDEAVVAAEAAVAVDERFGGAALLMRSRQWLATALLERRRGNDVARGVDELTRAIAAAHQLGYVLVADECQRLLDARRRTR